MWSTLTTDSLWSPFRRPTGSSVDKPRIVLVIGATVTRVRWGRTNIPCENQHGPRLIQFGEVDRPHSSPVSESAAYLARMSKHSRSPGCPDRRAASRAASTRRRSRSRATWTNAARLATCRPCTSPSMNSTTSSGSRTAILLAHAAMAPVWDAGWRVALRFTPGVLRGMRPPSARCAAVRRLMDGNRQLLGDLWHGVEVSRRHGDHQAE